MSLEFNKIAGAVLAASLGAMVIGKVAGALVHPSFPEKPHIAVQEAAVEAKPGAAPVPVPALPPNGDAAAGKIAFDRKCLTCHTPDKGGANKVGPNLFGIHGGKKAHLAGFAYSANMQAKGGEWDDATLNEFLWKPATYIRQTKMAFAGLSNDKERADVIAYLKSLK
ncbi:MAG: c-type cytochrome [Alphaproteobacteria bacterium]|nr:c-type cytochrome [Alphaproteobacteria bacterium]MCW5741727.1 c-type cytochrome [Alphaproteobacteria bacterium]